MCTTIDAILAVVDVVRFGIEVKDSIDAKKEAEYQTEMIRKQAKQKEQDAAYERQEGIEEARRARLKSILNMGEEKTALASGNIALSSATAINLVDDEKLNGELDALVTLKDSEKRAEKYIRQSQNYYQNAALTSYRVKNNFTNSLFKSTADLTNKSMKHFSNSQDRRK